MEWLILLKVWKVRKAAYEESTKEFAKTPDESAPIFTPFIRDSSLLKGAVTDSNVAAQQDGIAALCAFLEFGGHQACTKTRHHTVAALAEKGLPSTRAATKTKSLEALMLYVELDTSGPVIEDLLPVLGNKQPKVIAATAFAITAIVRAYGCKVVDPKSILKQLPKLFGHADKNVRAESQALALELYRWLRDGMKPTFWNDLKPVQQKELDEQFDRIKTEPAPKQERLLRSQQAQQAARAADGNEGETAQEEEGPDESIVEVDAFDLMEPVDVQKALPEEWHESVASAKWKDRKEALDALHAAANIPRIRDDDYGEIMRVLAKCMKDANVAVVTVAANCIEDLAKGLRRSFAKYRLMVLEPVFERLKEKKQSVVDALAGALDAICLSTSLTDCLEMILGFLKHKNPNVKLESMRFLIRMLKLTRDAPSKAEVKSMVESAKAMFTDANEVVRTGGAEVIGVLMKIFGERQMNPYTDGLDDIRTKKIKEFFETAQVKAKDKPPPVVVVKPANPVATKKVVGGKKLAPGTKKLPSKHAAPAVTPHSNYGQSTPSKSNGPSKLAAPSRSGLPGPGGAEARLQKRPAGSGAAAAAPEVESPRRQLGQSAPADGTAASRMAPNGRGLAGRPLGKPAFSVNADDGPPNPGPMASASSSVDRAELEALRADNARLQRQHEELRSEKSQVISQMHEVQNHNAQMIEDHTRDMLSIKAKETQLVRARSDAEAAEQMCQRLQREMDRLKRELSRAVRAGSPAPSIEQSDSAHREAGMNGLSRLTGHGSGRDQRMSHASSSMSEEKENPGYEHGVLRSSKAPPSVSSNSSYQGRGSSGPRTRNPHDSGEADAGGGGGGTESWQRAAEVTSQLKARIEQMKVSSPMFVVPERCCSC